MTASPEHDLLREQREMPMRGNCVLFATMLAALMLLGSTATRASFASRQIAGDTPANARTKTATLVVFNDSGPSAIPFRLSVEENGRTIVRLSRHQYERVMIAPGRHVFNIPPRQKPRVALDAEAGHTYFLVAAHRPERSYVPLLFGSPFVLKQIEEGEAQRLATEMKEYIRETPESLEDGEEEGPPISFHTPASPKQSPGVSITLEELSRVLGRKGTRVTYALRAAGFPTGRSYKLLQATLSTKWERTTLSLGLRADESGSLVDGTLPIEKLTVSIEDYNEGEAMLVEALADDGSIYAIDKVYPFPLLATDEPCQVWAELVDESRKKFLIFGWGFEPGEQAKVSSTDGHDPKDFMQPVEESGGFQSVVLHGRSGGTAVFSAAGAHCHPTLTYPFGNESKGVQ